jgi:hypothetical protein
MTPEEQYRDLAKRLNEIGRVHQKAFSEFNASLKFAELNALKIVEPLMKEFDRINSLKLTLPALDNLLNSPALQAARLANLAISKLSVSPQVDFLAKELSKTSELWKSHLAPFAQATQLLGTSFLGIQSEVARMSQISILAERTLANIDFAKVGLLNKITEGFQNSVRATHFALSDSYSILFKSLEDSRLTILSVPPVVSSLPPVEFYFGNRFIEAITTLERSDSEDDEAISTDLQKETKDDIEIHLARFDESLIKLWQGAVQALSSDNPDAVRHSSISLRELLTHIIHRLAPDDQIRAWNNSAEMYNDGKPTRKARLLYICRGINHAPFSRFLRKDIDSTLASFEVLQEGTHAIDTDLSRTQLDLLRIRTECSIRFLIRTYVDSSGA